MSTFDPDGPTVIIPRPKAPAGTARPSPQAPQVRVRGRIYAALDWVKHAGVSLDWLERTIDYWRDLGVARAVAITLLVVTPLVKFVWLPWMGSGIVATVADVYGLDLEVGGWSGSWLDLKATASDLTLKSRGRHTRASLAEADAITIDLSFWRWLGGHGWVKAVHVKEPKVFLERSLAGRWNWDDLQNVSAGSVRAGDRNAPPRRSARRVDRTSSRRLRQRRRPQLARAAVRGRHRRPAAGRHAAARLEIGSEPVLVQRPHRRWSAGHRRLRQFLPLRRAAGSSRIGAEAGLDDWGSLVVADVEGQRLPRERRRRRGRPDARARRADARRRHDDRQHPARGRRRRDDVQDGSAVDGRLVCSEPELGAAAGQHGRHSRRIERCSGEQEDRAGQL